jgi:hypothetical protein
MKYAIIETGIVANIVIADAEYAVLQGWVKAGDLVEIGWSYVDGEFVDLRPVPEPAAAPPPPTKEELLAQLQALQAQITALGETPA